MILDRRGGRVTPLGQHPVEQFTLGVDGLPHIMAERTEGADLRMAAEQR